MTRSLYYIAKQWYGHVLQKEDNDLMKCSASQLSWHPDFQWTEHHFCI